MLEVSTAAWAATIGLIVLLLAADLALAARNPHAVGFREAAAQSVFYIGVAIAFGIVFGTLAGWDYGSEYFAGWVVEKSLSVDNLFVFVIIMTTFAVPAEHQHKVLTFGIVAALIMRAIFHRHRRGAAGSFQLHVRRVRAAADRHGDPTVPPP